MRLILRLALFTVLTQIVGVSLAQDVDRPKANFPETEIFLFALDLNAQDNIISGGKNVTNRDGYDNQPFFTKDSASFIYSRGDEYQTDVYEYFLESGELRRLTHSATTEFSPTPTPDNLGISFVSDRNASIWLGKRDDIENPEWVQANNNNREPIGYYAWNHTTGDILYWSQYGFSVSLTHESSQNFHFISGHAVPSTPHIIPGTNNFSFVHRQTNGQVWIKEFNPENKSIRPITPVVGSNANYGWTPDGSILMIENDKLYQWSAESTAGWRQIADLSEFGIHSANRVAISPDARKLAVVGLPTVTQPVN
jgi:Tol biopolymer transport system component